jgi:hypothetical protein
MTFLKSIALGLVGFWLFFTLSLLCLASTLNLTALNPQFAVAEVEKLDLESTVREMLADRIPLEESYLTAIDNTITELKPWIDQQISEVISACYDYLLSRAENIDLNISIETLKSVLVDKLTQAYLQSSPPEYLRLSPSEKDRFIKEMQQQTLDLFPSTIEINFETLGSEAKHIFEQGKTVMGYFRTVYYGLIGLAILMLLLMILILRKLRVISRSMGIVFILVGAVSGISCLIIKNVLAPQMSAYDIIPQLQTWMPMVIKDIASPLAAFGIAFAIVGAILLGVSFIRKKPASIE